MNTIWSLFNGTIVNVVTVIIGSTIGLVLSTNIPDRFRRIILNCLGLVTITIGIDAAVLGMLDATRKHSDKIPTYGARLAMVMIGSLIIGAIIGSYLRLHDRIEGLGRWFHTRYGGPQRELGSAARFAEGYLSASVIFCIGPLTVLGCLSNGASGNPGLLYIKSFLDGFCSIALAASLGVGVLFSCVTVLVLQGGLSLAAYFAAGVIPDLSLSMMNAVGGIVLLATSLMILEIKKIPVADLVPGIILPPIVVWAVEKMSPGLILVGS